MAEFIPILPEEEGNDTSWYTAGAAGIASGIIKVPEGVFSLAAELIDLGLDTNTAAGVEQFFDTLNPFEEVAEKNAAGKLTEALVSIGIPSTVGFKVGSRLAKKAIQNKKIPGKSISAGNKNMVRQAMKADSLNKRAGTIRFAAGVAGGAAGETMVADIEEIGTFGDMFESGPTTLDRLNSEGREDATRKLMNRIKFGTEGLLITPFIGAVAKGGKALSRRGRDLAFSDSKFDRAVSKIATIFTPEGKLTKDLFKSQRVMEQFMAKDKNEAARLVRNLTVAVDSAFPEMQKVLDKTLTDKQKTEFYEKINTLLFDGDISKGVLDPKKSDAFIAGLKKEGITGETSGKIIQALEEARGQFANLAKLTDNQNKSEITDILKDRIAKYVGNTYKIFEDKPILGIFNKYAPSEEAMTNAINFFRAQIAKKDVNAKTPFNPDGDQYFQEARQLVNNIIGDADKLKKAEGLPNVNYINKTLEGQPGAEFIKKFMAETGQPPKVIRKLLGEMKDPRLSIFNAISNLSVIGRQTRFLDEVYNTNRKLQADGQRGAFWNTKEAAEAATNGVVPIVRVSDTLSGLGKAAGEDIVNPLVPLYTTKDIADGLAVANHLKDTFLTSFAKGREGASVAEKGASWLYRNLLLVPKGISQLAKTVLSIPTHIRNLLSAGAFAGANGILFTNPKDLANAFKEGAQISGLFNLRNFRKDELEKAYQEMLELGIVNSQVQIGDIKNLFRDVKYGDAIGSTDAVLRPMMNKLKAIPTYLQGKYVAEDDFWKITNYFVEMSRRDKAYKAANIVRTKDELKKEAAEIVKNTVPNYAYVGDIVRTARLLPVGNFMSFPSEIIRTTGGIGSQILKEVRHSKPTIGTNVGPYVIERATGQLVKNDNPMYSIGVTRALGMATTLTAVPTAVVEGAKMLYDVTEDEIAALRQFVPEWSKNSTIVPVRDDNTGELKYIDFSHSNAYDLMARPFRTLALGINDAQQNDQTLLRGFTSGIDEAITELASPFIDESIFTEALADLTVRGGRTLDGRQLYTDQTSFGDKKSIEFRHLMVALAPSYKQGVRLYQTATDTPTKAGELLEGKTLGVNDQIAGFMGLRPIKVDPLKAMGFKIAEYQRGIREARREFTGGAFGLLRGGPIDEADIINRFIVSNKARFNVQKEMYKNIAAADILGTNVSSLRKEFKDRQLSDRTFRNLQRGRFDPYFPSDDIIERFREIARNLGDVNAFTLARPDVRTLQRDFRNLSFPGQFSVGGSVQLPQPLSLLEKLKLIENEMKTIPLDGEFDIETTDYVPPKIKTPPLGPQPQPVVDIQPNMQQINPQTNLTRNQEALLSPMEKVIASKRKI